MPRTGPRLPTWGGRARVLGAKVNDRLPNRVITHTYLQHVVLQVLQLRDRQASHRVNLLIKTGAEEGRGG